MRAQRAFRIGICVALLAATPALADGWRVDDTISALDGSRTYAALLQSTNTLRTSAGTDEHSTLVVRCARGFLEAYIAWPQGLGAGPLDMRWRVDAGNYTVEVWDVSDDGTATFTEKSRAFLGMLKAAHRASFQVTLSNADSLVATFDLDGTGAVVDTALSACPH